MSSILPSMGGFRWVRSRTGASRPPIETAVVITNNATAIFRGDAIGRVTTGEVQALAAGDATIALGVVEAVERYKDATVGMRGGVYLPASTVYTGGSSAQNPLASIVSYIPFGAGSEVFEVDFVPTAATTYTTLAAVQAIVNKNSDLVAGAGSTTNGMSGHYIEEITGGAATAQFRIIEIPRYGSDNELLNDVTSTARFRVNVVLNETYEPPYKTTGG